MWFFRKVEIAFKEIPSIASQSIAGVTNPAALAFYRTVMSGGYEPSTHIKILQRHKLIYVAIPKSASTRIGKTLAHVEGRFSRSLKSKKRSTYRGPYGLRNITVGSFYDVATDPRTLRFSFVRNPYARLVSCWADKFANKPLMPGDVFIDALLKYRHNGTHTLRAGIDQRLAFPDFVDYVIAADNDHRDSHYHPQHEILSVPGIKLDFVGKVESFDIDIIRVLDHVNATDDVRREARTLVNESHHDDWAKYYTRELANRVYQAYEQDFDRFNYPRAIPKL